MGKKHRNLIDLIADDDNLQNAYYKTAKGKKRSFGYLEFKEYDQINIESIKAELLDSSYTIGSYRHFTVYEPKPRLIYALDFKDRLVQHALCNVIAPIFDKSLLPYTFACRKGKGTHAGIRHVQSTLRREKPTHFLKTDYSKFFPSVDLSLLHRMIFKKIRCEKTLILLRQIIPTSGKGIPIGSLTSQIFANVYGNVIDRFIHFELGHRHWARYMDDIVILDNDPERLKQSFVRIKSFSQDHMGMGISKWQLSPVSKGIDFLGYRIWSSHKLLRKDSVFRAKRKVSNCVKHKDQDALQKFIGSWSGHAKWADTHNLFTWMEKRYGIVI